MQVKKNKYCNCYELNGNHSRKFKITTVDEDGLCEYCGHYPINNMPDRRTNTMEEYYNFDWKNQYLLDSKFDVTVKSYIYAEEKLQGIQRGGATNV